jgi:hypothetical protein
VLLLWCGGMACALNWRKDIVSSTLQAIHDSPPQGAEYPSCRIIAHWGWTCRVQTC